jgi:RimJ/RimL family protein N-acetyltransferase
MFRGVELDEVELTGPRLTLRRWRPEDASVVEAASRSEQMRLWFALPDPYTAEDAADFVTRTGNAERDLGTGLGCAVTETATGRLVGSAELRLPRPDRPWPDIGYWLVPAAFGRGYAAEATRILTEWAFEHGVSRVELRMDAANVASARTALAAGFTFDGVCRGVLGLPDGRHDLATFGRLASDSGDPVRPALPRLPTAGLTDGTVTVRVLEAGDRSALIEQERDAVTVANGFTGVPPDDVDLARIAARAALDWMVGLGATFAVVDRSSGAYAGTVRLRTSGPPQIGGIGYAVHPRFRGRGYTARALRLIVPWVFEEADFARLELGAKASNVASQKVALAAGFEPDGIRARRMRTPNGTFVDEVRFALVNPKYR